MEIIPIFPTIVGKFAFNRDLTLAEKTFIIELEKRKNQGNLTSVDSYILKQKKLKNIKNFLTNSLNYYFQNIIKPKEQLEIYITQSWLNFANKGEYHHRHSHPNSILSGVFYVSAVENIDKIIFYNEHRSPLKIECKEFDSWNAESWWLPASTNILYIFPSYLEHNVLPVEHDKTRISLSFNTFLKGKIGSANKLTELII